MNILKRVYLKLEEKNFSVPLLILLFIVLVLRLPSLLEPCWHGDEGIYLTIGQALRHGKMLYRDIHDNKPPLLYWAAAVAGSFFWLRFLALLAAMGGATGFYYLARHFFPSKKSFWLTIVFIFLMAIPCLEGNTANAETFFVPLTVIGFCFFVNKKYFKAGLLMGLSFLFKSPPLFDFVAMILFVFWPILEKKLAFNLLKQKIIFLTAGFALPVFMTLIYYSIKGILPLYLESAFLLNFPYLSSWSSGGNLFSSGLFRRAIILLLVLAGMIVWQKKKSFNNKSLLVFLWFLLALFGALLSSRPYPHYLLQVVPSFLLLGGLVVFRTSKTMASFFIFALFLIIGAVHWLGFYFYPLLSYYQNLARFALGQKNRLDYWSWFDNRVPRDYQVAGVLQELTNEDDEIFIWGNEPSIYALSRRQPASRYAVAYHIQDFKKEKEVLQQLRQTPPAAIVYDTDFEYSFPGFNTFLSSNYLLLDKIGSLQIWHHFQ